MAKVTVVGGSPVWQRGFSTLADESGYEVRIVDRLSDWQPTADRECIVTTDVNEIPPFRAEHRFVPVVAVLDEVDLASVARSIRAGATGVLGEHDDPDEVVTTLDRAMRGRVVLPLEVVAAMARMVPEESDTSSWVSATEVEWLRWMARGGTVADLAEDTGYSERAMFRQLKTMYERLGVRNRTEALLWASQRGLLEDENSS